MRKATERGFTLVEMLIVLALLSILTSVALPSYLQAKKRAEVGALMAEAREFQQALLRYHADFGTFPTTAELDTRTLEPLVSRGYLRSNALVNYARGGSIHQYSFDPTLQSGDGDQKQNQGKHKGHTTGKGKAIGRGKLTPSGADGSLVWHLHPRFQPYDQGPQDMRIEGNASGIHVDYMGKELDPSEALPLIQ